MARNRIFALACFVCLSACASMRAPGRAASGTDWAQYGASLFAASAVERREIYASAARTHEDEPTDTSAIRLAIATLGTGSTIGGYEDAMSLLEFAAGITTDDGNRNFIALLRPLVADVLQSRAALEAETRERQSLENQLEALKALEAQLNAGSDRR